MCGGQDQTSVSICAGRTPEIGLVENGHGFGQQRREMCILIRIKPNICPQCAGLSRVSNSVCPLRSYNRDGCKIRPSCGLKKAFTDSTGGNSAVIETYREAAPSTPAARINERVSSRANPHGFSRLEMRPAFSALCRPRRISTRFKSCTGMDVV